MVDESRRALLRRAAVAGGVAWVTPLVLADPARADSGTPKCRPALGTLGLSLTVSRQGSAPNQYPRVRLAISNAPSTCPCAGLTTFASQVKWVGTPPSGTKLYRVGTGPYSSGTYETFNTTTRDMNLVDSASTNDLNVTIPRLGFTLTAVVRYSCSGTGRTTAEACASRAITFGWNGNIDGSSQGTLAKNVSC